MDARSRVLLYVVMCIHTWQLIGSKDIQIKYSKDVLEPAGTTVSTVEKYKVLSTQCSYLHVLNGAAKCVCN